MKIAILSRNQKLYTTKRLYESATSRQHTAYILDVGQANRWAGFTSKVIRPVLPFQALIPRIGISATAAGLRVLRQLEATPIITTASSWGIAHSRNKWQSLLLLQSANLPTPHTIALTRPEQLVTALDALDQWPIIIKIPQGTQGQGVFLAKDKKIAKILVNSLLNLGQKQLLFQEYIGEAQGRDLRLLVVGNHCVAAMQRIAPRHDFRANVHLGASTLPFTPDEAIITLAIKATQIHRLAVAGIDIIQSNRGPLILEVNSSPGLEGIERTTQVDIAGQIINFLEQEYAGMNHE